MADPTALSGLLDPATIQQLQAYMAQMQPSDAEKQSARAQALMAAGLGMLASNHQKNPFPAIGQGGLLGVQQYNKDLGLLAAQRGQNVTQALQLMNLARQNQALQDQGAVGNAVASAYGAVPGAAPTPQPSPAPAGPPPMGAIGGASIAPPPGYSAPSAANGTPGASATPPNLGDPYTMLMSRADQMENYARTQQGLNGNARLAILNQAEKYREQALKFRDENQQMQTVMGPDGPTLIQPRKYGQPQQLAGYTPAEKLVQTDIGGKIFFTNPLTGDVAPGSAIFEKTQTPESKASNALGYANLAETKRYHNLEMGMDETGSGTTNIDNTAKAIATYQQPPLSSFAMARPLGAAVMGKVMEINPNYDAKKYATAQQVQNAFAKGTQGNTVRSIGVAMQHLDVLQGAGDALQNGDVQALNRLGNWWQTQTGGPAPTNFNAVKDLVANEITKAITGTGGGVSDRDKAQKTVDAANSPAQLSAVIGSYKQLFAGQLAGLKRQYESGTDAKDFEQKFLSPETAALLHSGGAVSTQPKIVDFSTLPTRVQ